jgi:DNA-binding response OmpR family regulator
MTATQDAASSRTILVADDDPDLLELMVRRLSRAGYRVIKASNGEEALQLVREHSPDMAVLDVMMPKGSGLEVLWQLRAEPATADMLIVMLSAGRFGPAHAADAYLRKPIAQSELVTQIESLFSRR